MAGWWTDYEDRYLIEHYSTSTAARIGKRLGRTKMSVQHRCDYLRAQAKRKEDWRTLDMLDYTEKCKKGFMRHITIPAYPDVPVWLRITGRM